MKTKDKILIEALSLFSVSGFSGVSVRDIAKYKKIIVELVCVMIL